MMLETVLQSQSWRQSRSVSSREDLEGVYLNLCTSDHDNVLLLVYAKGLKGPKGQLLMEFGRA